MELQSKLDMEESVRKHYDGRRAEYDAYFIAVGELKALNQVKLSLRMLY